MYSTPMEAFRDLILSMNSGATTRLYAFRESNRNCDNSLKFSRMLKTITERPIRFRRDTNTVEVRIL